MLDVIIQMAALILCGVVWRRFKPAGLAPDETRKVLTTLVYLIAATLYAPALWLDPLGPLVKAIPAAILALLTPALLVER